MHEITAPGAPASLEAITGNENVLVLVPGPAAESLGCGGLIAQCCRRGRPPFVMVLTDGSATTQGIAPDRLSALHEVETRAAVACLGLPSQRLLMAGLFDGTIPDEGPVFEAVARAVTLVMWARDCNVVCAPWPAAGEPERATYRIAQEVAVRSGVGLLAYACSHAAALRLDITPDLPAKQNAIAAHRSHPLARRIAATSWETFLLPAGAAARV
jgi:LmbE family N-acetylglucosaminyl deacetylase